MATTLWDKFQSAVRYVRGTTEAAVATILAAPMLSAIKFIDAGSSATAAPSSVTDGVDVEGIRDVDVSYVHSASGASTTVTAWLYNGSAWCAYQSIALDQDTGVVDALNTGSFSRLFLQITTATSSGTVDVYVSPHNA